MASLLPENFSKYKLSTIISGQCLPISKNYYAATFLSSGASTGTVGFKILKLYFCAKKWLITVGLV